MDTHGSGLVGEVGTPLGNTRYWLPHWVDGELQWGRWMISVFDC